MGVVKIALALAMMVVARPAAARGPADWQPYIAEASARFSLPEAWIRRVMAAESQGRTTLAGRPIRSPKGAIGLMQLMPDTWVEMRKAYGLGADPDDPHDNILAGAAYLRLMYDRFGYPGLFGAYNAGPRRYAAYITGQQRLPRETRDYLAALSGTGQVVPGAPLERSRTPLFLIARDRPDDPQPVSGGRVPLSPLFAIPEHR